jgi:hypothetical protein
MHSPLLLLWLPAKLKREGVVLKAMAMVAGVGVIGFALSLVLPGLSLRFAALVLGGACNPLLCPCFWSLPPRYFTGARAAASIAAINSIGNLGGFFAQNLMPYVGKLAGNTSAPMLVPVVCLALLGVGMSIAWASSGRSAPGCGTMNRRSPHHFSSCPVLHSARRGQNLARISSLVRRAKSVFRDAE